MGVGADGCAFHAKMNQERRTMMPISPHFLAACLLIGLLLLLLAALGVLGTHFVLRRRRVARQKRGAGTEPNPLSLRDLRDLLERGEITVSEFEALRDRIVASVADGGGVRDGRGG